MEKQNLLKSVGFAGGALTVVLIVIYILFFAVTFAPGLLPDMDTSSYAFLCCCPLPFLFGAGGALGSYRYRKLNETILAGNGVLVGTLTGVMSSVLSFIVGLVVVLGLVGSAFKSDTLGVIQQLQSEYGVGLYFLGIFLGYFLISVVFSAVGGLVGAMVLNKRESGK